MHFCVGTYGVLYGIESCLFNQFMRPYNTVY